MIARAALLVAVAGCCGPVAHPAVVSPPVTAVPGPAAPAAPARPPGFVDWASAGVAWDAPPPGVAAPGFVPPTVERFTLASGVTVLLVENHRLPLVSIQTLHLAAGSREDGGRLGLAALTADLLDEGAGALTAETLPEELERQGASLDTAVTADHATVTVTTLAETLPRTLTLIADLLRRPTFRDADVARVKADRLAALALRKDRPRTVAALLFDAVVFGEHPYGRAADGTATTVAALTAADVRAFWRRAYGPTTTTLIIAGDVRRAELEPLLAASLGDWRNPAPVAPRTPLVAGRTSPVLAYVDRPDAPQTVVMIGRRALAAGDARLIPAEVESTLLGGSFASRLNHRLREELGYTYGINASFWRGQWGGTWSVSSSIKTAETVAGVTEALRLIEQARTADAPGDELARTQALLIRGLPQQFETNRGVAAALARQVAARLPDDYYATYPAEVGAVTPATARGAVAALWQPLSIVVVGDWRLIGPGLSKLGLPVVHYDADGRVVR